MSSEQVLDEHIDMDSTGPWIVAPLEREPLAVRGGSRVTHPSYHSVGVPPTTRAQNPASARGSRLFSTISRIQPIGASVIPAACPWT